MATYKTTGIVIRRSNFGEADRVITFLTPDHGKIRAVAKGVRRIKSRMAGHLELFGTAEVMLAEGRNLDIITSARLTRSAEEIAADYEKLSMAYLFAEMVDRLVEDGQEHPDLFMSLETTYQGLTEKGISPELELGFKLQLLDVLGYKPHLDGCTVCHQKNPEQSYFLSPAAGGLVCANCTAVRSLPMNLNQIKLWRIALDGGFTKLQTINGAGELAKQTMPALEEFYDYTFGKRFRTQSFLTGLSL